MALGQAVNYHGYHAMDNTKLFDFPALICGEGQPAKPGDVPPAVLAVFDGSRKQTLYVEASEGDGAGQYTA